MALLCRGADGCFGLVVNLGAVALPGRLCGATGMLLGSGPGAGLADAPGGGDPGWAYTSSAWAWAFGVGGGRLGLATASVAAVVRLMAGSRVGLDFFVPAWL